MEEPLLSPHLVAIVQEALPLLEQQLPAAVANRVRHMPQASVHRTPWSVPSKESHSCWSAGRRQEKRTRHQV